MPVLICIWICTRYYLRLTLSENLQAWLLILHEASSYPCACIDFLDVLDVNCEFADPGFMPVTLFLANADFALRYLCAFAAAFGF